METRDDTTTPVRRRSTTRRPRRRTSARLKALTLTRPRITALLGLLTLGLGLAITLVAVSDSTVTIHGSVTLGPATYLPDGTGACTAGDGYSDISAGTAVIIGDQTGATIAVGQLQAGRAEGDSASFDAGCRFAFDVQAPGDRTLYTVTVSHRGTQTFTPAQIRQADLVLGSGG